MIRRDEKILLSSVDDFIYSLNYLLLWNVSDLNPHQDVSVIKWNENNEKVFKHFIFVGSILCHVICN